MGPGTSLVIVGKRKISYPYEDSNPKPKLTAHTLYQLCPSGSLDYELQKANVKIIEEFLYCLQLTNYLQT